MKSLKLVFFLILMSFSAFSQDAVDKPFKITGRLFYDDYSVSSFDIINDKSIALWNVIIGGGDAQKPAHGIVIRIEGDYQWLNLTVKNSKKIVYFERDILSKGTNDILILDIGCEKLLVEIDDDKKIIYTNYLDFKCGE